MGQRTLAADRLREKYQRGRIAQDGVTQEGQSANELQSCLDNGSSENYSRLLLHNNGTNRNMSYPHGTDTTENNAICELPDYSDDATHMHIDNCTNPSELHGPPEYTVDNDYPDEAPPPYSADPVGDIR